MTMTLTLLYYLMYLFSFIIGVAQSSEDLHSSSIYIHSDLPLQDQDSKISGIDRTHVASFSEEVLARLKERPNRTIPIPSFEVKMSELSQNRKLSLEDQNEWRAIQAGKGNLRLVHGFNFDSLREQLNVFYSEVESLSDEDVLQLAPWTLLSLKHVVSASLTNTTAPESWYSFGFVLSVPPNHLYAAGQTDALVRMERTTFSKTDPDNWNQDEFRKSLMIENDTYEMLSKADQELCDSLIIKGTQEFKFKAGHKYNKVVSKIFDDFIEEKRVVTKSYGPKGSAFLSPKKIAESKGSQNEVAFFSSIAGSSEHVKIVGVYLLSSSQSKYDGAPLTPSAQVQIQKLAKKLQVPFYDWRKKEKIDPQL